MKRSAIWGMVWVALTLAALLFLRVKPPQIPSLTANASTNPPANATNPTPAEQKLVSSAPPARSAAVRVVAKSEADEDLQAITNFSNWAGQFLSGNPPASVAQGQALAWKRREAMLKLIETDPEKALELAVPFGWRSALPPDITRYFEQWVDGRGALDVAIAENFNHDPPVTYRQVVVKGQGHRAFVYGRRLTQRSQTNIPVHGIALDDKLALHSDPIRVLESGEAVALEKARKKSGDKTCGVCGQPAGYQNQEMAADIGGETAYFCGPEHLKVVSERWVLAESGGGGGGAFALSAGGGDTWTQGRNDVLYMRVNFPDDLGEPISEASAYNAMDDVNVYYVEGSYDTTWLTTTVTPLVTLPQIKVWYATAGPFALLSDARDAARTAGFDTANYQWDIVSHTTVPGFDWSGLGMVGGKGTWLQSPGAFVTAHELGHNHGLPHANFWDSITNRSVIGSGTNIEYGNIFDVMGSGPLNGGHFGALFKNALGWLPDTCVHDITSNGLYRIHPFDVPHRVNGQFYAAKVRKDFDRDYWLEFREAIAGNPSLQNGVLLNWSPWEQSHGGTSLLDTTPDTDRSDSTVIIGRTFSDLVAGVHITPVARGTTGTNSWIDVQVNLGFFPENRPPELKVEVDPTNAAPGALVHFHATATDPDGDALAYAWTFDDSSVSTNNLPWTFNRWGAPGEHVVRCVVSDMKGGVASANVIVTVGQPAGFRVSGRVVDLEGEPIQDVRVDSGAVSYTDSDGRYVLVGLTGDVTVTATKYGLAFTNFPWTNPIALGSNAQNIDLTGMPTQTVSLAVSTNLLRENDNAPNTLALTRIGDTNADLTVTLFVSGTATPGSDLTFSPALAVGTNSVVIPAGVSNVTFTFSAVNNGTVEPTEVANVTILDDPLFVIARRGEASITIFDDDQAALPSVSVRTESGFVPEHGDDSGSFVFARTGSTGGDLPVFYSVGGTATAGTDYPTLLGVVIIPAGRSSAQVQFRPLDDKDVESDETVTVTIGSSPTYAISNATATATIVDDDLLVVTISPTSAAMAEPSSAGRLTVKRDGDQTANLVVYYNLGGVAINGVDYQSPSGAVTIPAGATSADIVLTALDDALTEGDESVVVTLTSNPGYDIGTPGSATLFIRDNEKVSVSIQAFDPAASEPGDDFGTFTISRGVVVNGALTVNLAISGTAIPGSDYVPLDNVVVIPDGSSQVTLDLIPFDDLHAEPVEDVSLFLIASTNYNLGVPRQAAVQIVDDDSGVPAVGFSFSTSSGLESETPEISVSLSATSSTPITVEYRVIGATASNNDYSLPPGQLTFAPGEWASSLPLVINDDAVVEPNETIRITLFNPINATHDGIKIHTFTIVDDDTASVSVSATAAGASETGPVPGNFRITRTGSTNVNLVVNFQITGTASALADYPPLGTSVNMPAGITSADLPVNPVNDGTVELDESVVMTLTSAPGAKIAAPGTAEITITDDDPNALPVVAVTSTNRPHAVEAGGSGEFVFTRTGSTNAALTLPVTFYGQASNGLDYLTLPNSVTIPAGQLSVTIPVTAVDDSLVEGEETAIVALTISDAYRAGYPASATVIVQDNDQTVRLDASDFDSSEPGIDPGAFTFTRFGTTNTSVRVFFTISGTAGNGVDYAAVSNSFVIPAGKLTTVLPIVPLDDVLREGHETVTLTLSSNAAYKLDQPTSATVTILDDEPMVRVAATVTNTLEGSRKPGIFTLTREGDPSYEFTVHLAVGGAAKYGLDYAPFGTNVFFSCGIVEIDLPVEAVNETVSEPNEPVVVAILPDPAYTILSPSNAVLTIEDAGTNQTPLVTITRPRSGVVFIGISNANMILEATVTDDGGSNTPPVLTWSKVRGPDTFYFGDTTTNNTTVSFTNGGYYVLRLTADDGQLQGYDQIEVFVDIDSALAPDLLYWRLDDGSGTSALDSSGSGRHGQVIGNANWVGGGFVDGALELDGANAYVREASGTNFLDGLRAFTLLLWVNTAATNRDQGLAAGNDSGTGTTLGVSALTRASCGDGTNVFEANLPTSDGVGRCVTLGGKYASGWHHLALTWASGSAPALYVNGELDQPNARGVAVAGHLVNCPQFIVGKGAPGMLNGWNGLVDDVRLFNRALSTGEIWGVGGGCCGVGPGRNTAPLVDAGTNTTFQIITPPLLSGTVTDDGLPDPPATVSNEWVMVSGPQPAIITDSGSLTTTVAFIEAGDYVFRLIADDGDVKMYDDVAFTVTRPTQVQVFATDDSAAELGPDTGEFTFYRDGDNTVELPVYFTFGGFASNGVDCVRLTNVVALAAGEDSTSLQVTPFLDDRIEGDEPLTLNIVSNAAYTIGNGSATVTIHDSPYGAWTVDHFTLEELTQPWLSSAGADFDHDGLGNFAEYAALREPKSPETNSPLVTTIELNPDDGKNHITLTYQRRLPPTDTAYAVYLSDDLHTWKTGTNYVEELQATDDGNGLSETVKARLKAPYPPSTNLFVTTRIRLLTTGP